VLLHVHVHLGCKFLRGDRLATASNISFALHSSWGCILAGSASSHLFVFYPPEREHTTSAWLHTHMCWSWREDHVVAAKDYRHQLYFGTSCVEPATYASVTTLLSSPPSPPKISAMRRCRVRCRRSLCLHACLSTRLRITANEARAHPQPPRAKTRLPTAGAPCG
jgi:hypothetical protein